MCDLKGKKKTKPEVIQVHQEEHQQMQNQQMNMQENIQEQIQNNQQHIANPMQENLGVVEVEVPNEAIEEMNNGAVLSTYDVVDEAQMVAAQMVSELSLNSFSMMGNASRKAIVERRRVYREKVNEKAKLRQESLKEEIQAHKSFLRQCCLYRDELEKKRIELLKKDNISEEELESAHKSYDDAVKTVDLQTEYVRKKEETYLLQTQAFELRNMVSRLREKCEEDSSDGDSTLMKNVIAKVRSFDELINSNDFDITKQYSYVTKLVQMHNDVAKYYEKNKGTKFSSKGRKRRDATKEFLSRLTAWVGQLPEQVQDTFLEEMEKPENEEVRKLESSKEMYQKLGEVAFGKLAKSENRENTDVKRFVNPLTIRMLSAARSSVAPEQEVDCISYLYRKLNPGHVTDEAVNEIVSAWENKDIVKLVPFYDTLVDRILNYQMKIQEFLPENIMKNGPTLYKNQKMVRDMYSLFKKGTLGEEYLRIKSPALKTKIDMIFYLYPQTNALESLCHDMNIGRNVALWKTPFNLTIVKPYIRNLVESPSKALEMEQDLPADNEFLKSITMVAKECTQKGDDYYSKENANYRRYKHAVELMAAIVYSDKEEEKLYSLFDNLIQTEDEICKCENLAKREELLATRESILKEFKLQIANKPKADELTRKNQTVHDVPNEKLTDGLASYKYVVTKEEADKYVKASNGFIAAEKLPDYPDLYRLVPSFPTEKNLDNPESRPENPATKKKMTSYNPRRGMIRLSKDIVSLYTKLFHANTQDEKDAIENKTRELSRIIERNGAYSKWLSFDQYINIVGDDRRLILEDPEKVAEIMDAISFLNDGRMSTFYVDQRLFGSMDNFVQESINFANIKNEDIKQKTLNLFDKQEKIQLDIVESAAFKGCEVIKKYFKTKYLEKADNETEESFKARKHQFERLLDAVLEEFQAQFERSWIELQKVGELDSNGQEIPVLNECSLSAAFYGHALPFFVEGKQDKEAAKKFSFDIFQNTEKYDEKLKFMEKVLPEQFEKIQKEKDENKKRKLIKNELNPFHTFEFHFMAGVGETEDGKELAIEGFAPETKELFREPLTTRGAIGIYKKGSYADRVPDGFVNYYMQDPGMLKDEVDMLKYILRNYVLRQRD